MGSYAQCWLGDVYVGCSKNDVDPNLMGLFRESDKHIVKDRSEAVPGVLNALLDELDDNHPIVYYEAPVPLVRDRLDVLGYTVENCRKAFNEAVRIERLVHKRMLDTPLDLSDHELTDSMQQYRAREYAILCELDVESWLGCLREIREKGLEQGNSPFQDGPFKDTLLGYVLSFGWYGHPGPDMNVALRLALEVWPEAQHLLYDLTDIVWQEYLDAEENCVEYALGIPAVEHQSSAKIVVLTEGKSDTEIIKQSLSLLFPHLEDYYSFMEFETGRVGGGAGNLANLVKAFAAAGIVNRTIAVFDNDTAATAALKTLSRIRLPSHIKVVKLPDRESLRGYPTIGPSGRVALDVNGVAASIELYLGEDVLRQDGEWTPVQWTGFDVGVRQYQGEVLDKQGIQRRFFEKLRGASSEIARLGGPEWDDLKAVFQSLFEAFHDFDQTRILADIRDYYSHEYNDISLTTP